MWKGKNYNSKLKKKWTIKKQQQTNHRASIAEFTTIIDPICLMQHWKMFIAYT